MPATTSPRWRRPGRASCPRAAQRRRGASTLSQQLAKLLYVGDERSVARKVRELLYAVELDRTLGKARVLQLYLSVAPWGDGQCGAEAAALHYFGKRAAALDAAEAVWLASLLRNPEAGARARGAGLRPDPAADDRRRAAAAAALAPRRPAARARRMASAAGGDRAPRAARCAFVGD